MDRKKLILILAVSTLTSACASTGGPNQTGGTLLGAIGGGIAGSQIGKGSGNVAATIGGTVLGGLIGGEVGKSMDDTERLSAQQYQAPVYSSPAPIYSSPAPVYSYEPSYYEPVYAPVRTCGSRYSTVYVNGYPQTVRVSDC